MALWVAAESGRAEVATGELQSGWREKVPILMCLGGEEIMIGEITSSGCHPRVGSCKYGLRGGCLRLSATRVLRASEGLAHCDVLLGKPPWFHVAWEWCTETHLFTYL